MRKRWLLTMLGLLLILAQVFPAYAQEAKAYATVLIIIPPRSKAQAAQQENLAVEKETAQEEALRQQEIQLAKSQEETKTETKISE